MKERYRNMKEQRTINGVVFDVKHISPEELHKMACYTVNKVKSLDDCYQRPSRTKQDIYDTWLRWSNAVTDLYTFDVDTYNTNVFTLSGVLEYAFGMIEVIHITPTKHILYTA